MISDPTIFLSLIISLVATSGALLAVAISYFKAFEKYNLLLKENERLKLQSRQKEIEILEVARQKAAKILSDAHFVDDNTKKEFQDRLKTVSLNEIKDFEKVALVLLEAYNKELADLKANTLKIVNNMTKDIEKNTEGELKDFEEIIKKETFAAQKIVEQKIEEDYQTTEKELQLYKQERLKKLDGEIYNLIEKVSTLAIGKALSLEDHEQLIIDALNRAKEEKIFR